jgi:hypothetical protein
MSIRQKQKEFTKELREFLSVERSHDEIKEFVKDQPKLTGTQLCEMVLHIAKPDKEGKSREITRDEIESIHHSFGNIMGTWQAALKKIHTFVFKHGLGNSWTSFHLTGFNDNPFSQTIRPDIDREIKKEPCVFCGCHSDIQTDHKDGRKNDPQVSNQKTQRKEHFQSTDRHCNMVKKTRCEECRKCGLRPDVRKVVPFMESCPVGWTVGGEQYDPNVGCEGCWFFDPRKFMAAIFKKYTSKRSNEMNTVIKGLIDIIPSSETMSELVTKLANSEDTEEKMRLAMQIGGVFKQMDLLKQIAASAEVDVSNEKEKNEKSKKSTKPSERAKTLGELGFKVGHLYKFGDGSIFKVKLLDKSKGSVTYWGTDTTGIPKEQWLSEEKKAKLPKVTSLPGYYVTKNDVENWNGTFWYKTINSWEDLGTEEEYEATHGTAMKYAA